jgi:3-isopropylmalate/(R)-2-methylmalate dehydratase small subunit
MIKGNPMSHYSKFTSKAAVISANNIDTDQIIPARYLKEIDKSGMGANLFADWRYNPDGSPKEGFVLNDKRFQDAHILLAGDNFGCGSSREHAPWALTGFGFKAVISTSFADIFRNNALKNGLLPVVVDEHTHTKLFDWLAEVPLAEVTVDLESQTLVLPDGEKVPFPIDQFSKTCLLSGKDELGYILSFLGKVEEYERQSSLGL